MSFLLESGARPLSLTIAIAMLIFIIWTLARMLGSQNQSQFRKHEYEFRQYERQNGSASGAAGSESQRASPLELEGFSADRKPHEILGVGENASKEEIQRAFKKLMLRFHPDRVGPPDSREWKDAQAIADAIIQAKDKLLARKTE